ncbi:hypothetical protein DPMN_132953 [Dreissena polymorpha]|uniref:Uncharacterized protein n=1 Tax=Dreissena polymorpha TaxID=45954 RepID=A0A9D4JAJ0_DREPO|nr:hypothetical protein DPMN_132953 [Dreissena polymorpha]
MTIFELNQDIHKTNVLTKFHDDWTKYVTSREKDPPPGGYVFLPIRTIFELNSRIQETNVLTKFHKDWAKNRKLPHHLAAIFFPLIMTIFKIVRDIHITNAKNVTSRVKKTLPGGHVFLPIRTIFELNRHIQETNILTKFHANWAKNVSSRLFTCLHYIHIEKTAPPPWRPLLQTKCGRTDGQGTKTNPKTSPEQSEINKTNLLTKKTAPPNWQPYIYKTNLFTKFHDEWAKNVTSKVHVIKLTRTIFQLDSRIKETNSVHMFSYIEKNAPPTGGHDFSPIWTIFELL